VILFPSLGLLFRLVLSGQLGHAPSQPVPAPTARAVLSASGTGLLARLAGACFVVGFGCLTIADARWAHAIGVLALLASTVLGTFALVADGLRSPPEGADPLA
jgi:hypothetical protein